MSLDIKLPRLWEEKKPRIKKIPEKTAKRKSRKKSPAEKLLFG